MKILLVEDDDAVRDSTAHLLSRSGYEVATFASGDEFLAKADLEADSCVLLDIRMPGTDGIGVLRALQPRISSLRVIMLTGHGDIPITVEAMKMGAMDFFEKPYDPAVLLQAIKAAIDGSPPGARAPEPRALAAVQSLSLRQRQVLAGMLCGHPNKVIAYEIGLSSRTVETYRAQLLTKLGVRGTAGAVKVALGAGMEPAEFRAFSQSVGEARLTGAEGGRSVNPVTR